MGEGVAATYTQSGYKQCIDWFVSQIVEEREEGLWDKKEQQFIKTKSYDRSLLASNFTYKEFYVDPSTNKLCRVEEWYQN